MGKVFKKAFRILGLDERKSGWVVEQDFHAWFLALFSSVLGSVLILLVWFERSLHSARLSDDITQR